MIQEPHCYHRRCKHLQGVLQPSGTEQNERPVCAAFPKGIPAAIAYGSNLHLRPYKGDHGIQYERDARLVANAEVQGLMGSLYINPAPFWGEVWNEDKAIHKRLYARYGRYVVYLVNGDKVRNSSEQMEAFTDWAIKGAGPSELPGIPKDEVWVEDTLTAPGRHVAISTALRYLETGSYSKALALAKREEAVLGGKENRNAHAHPPANKLYKQGPLTTPVGTLVYLVDGALVREHYKTDFVLGGNGEAYKWMPKFEIWVEADVQPDERIYILIHELTEWWQMATEEKGYAAAHAVAERVEYRWRHSGGRPVVEAMTDKWVQRQVESAC